MEEHEPLYAIDNAKVVTPDAVLEGASVIIEEGVIRGVSRRAQRGPGRLDAGGGYVLPGLVDLHSDAIEKHLAPRPGVELPLELAFLDLDRHLVSCGVTTVLHAISFRESGERSVERGLQIRDLVARLRPEGLARHGIHLRCELPQPESVETVEELLLSRDEALVSLTDHTPGQGQYRDLDWYRRYQKEHRGASEEEVRAALSASAQRDGALILDRASRISRAASRNGTTLASHDDDTPERVERMSQLGAGVSEFPITADAAKRAKELGLHVCMGAPNVVRGVSSGGNLGATEAVRLGLVDALCSDYHPPSLLQSAFKLARERVLELPRAVSLLTRGPSRAAGLCGRGEIREGAPADLVVVGERFGLPATVHTVVGGRQVFSSPA